MNGILIGTLLFTLPLFALYQTIVGSIAVSLPMTIIMIVAGFLFVSVSAYMAGLVGSSNNPVSGITICTILFASLVLMLLMGKDAALGPVAAIMIGAVVCCAACIGGDNLQDLKCGYIVGATPWKQQVMLAIGAASSALVMAPVLNLLLKAYGIGVPTAEHPDPLIAPQATLMASVAKGMFGGYLPWGMISIGAAIGVAVIAWDLWLKRRGSEFRAPVLAVAVGIYLPLELAVPIFAGGLLAWLVEKKLGVHGETPGRRARQAQRHAVRRRPHHRRGADGHLHRHPDRDVRAAPTCSRCPPACSSAAGSACWSWAGWPRCSTGRAPAEADSSQLTGTPMRSTRSPQSSPNTLKWNQTRTARPTSSVSSTKPQYRLSALLSRLSPIRK